VVLSVSYSKVEELYVQNPEFGFYFLRLASARLFDNIDKLEKRLAQQTDNIDKLEKRLAQQTAMPKPA
jgi:signal-transduction protein with cAMP-binding, CBS, and nucleotidyltransferase domain